MGDRRSSRNHCYGVGPADRPFASVLFDFVMSSGEGTSLPQADQSLLGVTIGHLCVSARRSDMEILMPLAMSSHPTLSVPSAGWRIREIPNRASSPKTQVHHNFHHGFRG